RETLEGPGCPARFREQIGHGSGEPLRVAVRGRSALRADVLVLEQGYAAVRGRGVEGEQSQGGPGTPGSVRALAYTPPSRGSTSRRADSRHAAVPPDEGRASGRPALLPHGRLLRALLRGR